MEDPQLELRDLIMGVIATTVTTEDKAGMRQAASMIDAAFQKTIMDLAKHAHAAGCERCGQLVLEMGAAKNASDEEAYDRASNELVSHMTLESDIAETGWLGGDGDGD